MRIITTIMTALAISTSSHAAETPSATQKSGTTEKHLFILSGQSNMVLLKPKDAFIPIIEKEYGQENVVVVKDAAGGRPIQCWYKNYKLPEGKKIKGMKPAGELYDRLIEKVKADIGDKKFDTVTFCWMQGERDAALGLGEVYEEAFMGVLAQLKNDLDKESIHFVIGRISDHGIQNPGTKAFDSWTQIREIQVKLANDDSNGQWIDTDDCNDDINRGKKHFENDLHMSKEGYKKMGERFAEKAIALIKGTAE